MKAWKVYDDLSYETETIVVFAETRGKAHAIAIHSEEFEHSEWNDLVVKRLPAMDYMYKGRVQMDWYKPEDRIALVKDCNFECFEIEYEDCKECPANEYCERYLDMKEEMEGEQNGD